MPDGSMARTQLDLHSDETVLVRNVKALDYWSFSVPKAC